MHGSRIDRTGNGELLTCRRPLPPRDLWSSPARRAEPNLVLMRAKDAMTAPVVTTLPDTPLREAAALLANNLISAIPVIDTEGCLLGIVSESDLIELDTTGVARRHEAPHAGRSGAPPERVADIMTADVVSVDEDTDLRVVAQRLLDGRIRRVPVLREGRVVGIVSRRDLVRWMARSDAVLAAEVFGVLRQEGHRLSQMEVSVRQGVAHLRGRGVPATLELAQTLARTIPGVAGAEIHRDDL